MSTRATALLLAATLLSGCLTNMAQRSQRVAVITDPPDASIWVVDSQGHRTMGRSPTAVMTSYEVEETEFLDACWIAPGIFGVGTIAAAGVALGTDDPTGDVLGLAVGITYGFMTLAALGGCLAGKELEGEEPLYQTVTIGASLPGREDTNVPVQIPGPEDLEVRLYLPPGR